MMTDATTTISELKDLTGKFIRERNWGKHNTPKNLAISIAIETAELLEHFQWDDYRDEQSEKEIEKELADVINYCFQFANFTHIDIARAVEKKLQESAKKYPMRLFNKKKDDPKEYFRIKKAHRMR